MNRIKYICLTGMVVTLLTTLALCQSTSNRSTTMPSQTSVSAPPAAQEPSLGSYARAQRKEKPHAANTFDNDNLPKSDKISVVGDAPATPQASADSQSTSDPATAKSDTTTTAAVAGAPPTTIEPGQSKEQRQQVYDQWQQKISIQQGQIDQAAHELDLDQREYRLRAASFYADAGERMRNQAGWDKEDADYKQKLAEKQKALDDAKAKLSDMQEEARKAGIPESAQQPPAPAKDSD